MAFSEARLLSASALSADHVAPRPQGGEGIPEYLSASYAWAYLNRKNARLLDHDLVVTAILLGNHRRLRHAALSEIAPGQSVLQASHVYGCLIPEMARQIGPRGHFDVIDLVPLQAALCRRKLRGYRHARVRIADAAAPGGASYDVVSCFFLLHEIPDAHKRAVVDALLARVAPGGKAVFVDYHRPARWHPLRAIYRWLFNCLEPFAESLWRNEIAAFARDASSFGWEKTTLFGGVYQKVVARRRF